MVAVGIFIMAMGVYAVIGQAPSVFRAIDSADWPKAPGRVVRAGVSSHHPLGAHNFHFYTADVAYTYLVGVSQHEGHLAKQRGFFTEGSALAAAARYPSDKVIDVAYDPRNPTVSWLEPGAHPSDIVRLAPGLGLVAVGFLTAFVW